MVQSIKININIINKNEYKKLIKFMIFLFCQIMTTCEKFSKIVNNNFHDYIDFCSKCFVI